jgi:phosphate transport system protein
MKTMMGAITEDLNLVKEKIKNMGNLCENALKSAARAHRERNTVLAKQIMVDDERINALELEIDELTFRLMPQKGLGEKDIRWLFEMLHVNTNLERIGNEAYRIARHSIFLNLRPALPPFDAVEDLHNLAREIFSNSLNGFLNSDLEMTDKVEDQRSQATALNTGVVTLLTRYVADNAKGADPCIHLILLTRSLAHVAELGMDIAHITRRMVQEPAGAVD